MTAEQAIRECGLSIWEHYVGPPTGLRSDDIVVERADECWTWRFAA